MDAITAVEATLSSLPDEVIASVDVSTKASEMELEERKKRLEILQQQEELIKVIQFFMNSNVFNILQIKYLI